MERALLTTLLLASVPLLAAAPPHPLLERFRTSMKSRVPRVPSS